MDPFDYFMDFNNYSALQDYGDLSGFGGMDYSLPTFGYDDYGDLSGFLNMDYSMPTGGDYGLSPDVAGWSQYLPSASSIPWGALALGGATLGSQYLGSQQAASQAEANWNKQFETWKQFAFPSKEAIGAATDAGKKTINQAMPGAYQALDEKLAGRGFSPGSGAIAKGFTDLEKQRVQDIGQLASKMAIYQNTPMFSPMGYPNTTSFGENLANTIGGVSGMASGMYLYDWLKNMK